MSTIATASDIRLKTHITPVSQTESLETILNLPSVTTPEKDGHDNEGSLHKRLRKLFPVPYKRLMRPKDSITSKTYGF